MKKHQLIAADSIQAPRITSIGFSDDPCIAKFGPSVRNQYMIHYVLSGKGVFNGNAVKKGEGFLILPGMKEEYHPDKDDPWSLLWIISDDITIRHFFASHSADSETGIFKFHNIYELESIAKLLNSFWDAPSSSAYLAELFLHVFNSCILNEGGHRNSVTRVYYEFCINYVKTNLHLPITVNNLCKIIGVTQPYLYEIFKKEAGCSPKQYIIGCKISEAKRLLLQTDFPISQIACAVGFNNVLDFSKFFSKRTSLSPTAYRNTHL